MCVQHFELKCHTGLSIRSEFQRVNGIILMFSIRMKGKIICFS